jgi:hypothetical protein
MNQVKCENPADEPVYAAIVENYKRSPGHITAPVSKWNYDMASCPRGVKCLLLSRGGVAVFAPLIGEASHFIAWAPMPQRDKEEERRRGLAY